MSGILSRPSANDVQAAIAADPEGALDALTPTRLLYIADIAAAWFNGDNTTLVGVIPLTAAEAVVGTKIRVRGEVKMAFQGASLTPGGDFVALAFNVSSSSAFQTQGVGYVVTGGASAVYYIDAELELKTTGVSKYKVGLGSSTPTYLGFAAIDGVALQRWGNVAAVTAFVEDPTTPEDVGSTAGLVVQLQTTGGTAKSICNFQMDLSYEIITA